MFEELSNSYPGIAFCKVDIEANPKAAANVAVKDVPYFMFFADGALTHHSSGGNVRLLKKVVQDLAHGRL